jgi:hypothetical protein
VTEVEYTPLLRVCIVLFITELSGSVYRIHNCALAVVSLNGL